MIKVKQIGIALLVSSVQAVNRRRELQVTEASWFLPVVIVVGVLLLCFTMCGVCSVVNKGHIDKKRREFESETLLADTAKGLVEYRYWGQAPYMLFMPGTPGFCNTSVGFERYGFGLLTVSRPGYGRTPMKDDRKTTTQQAELILALLDELKIDKIPMYCASGAGIIGLRLAHIAPDRFNCLALACATTGKLDHPMFEMFEKQEGKAMLTSPTMGRIGAHFMPGMADQVIAGDLMTANNQKKGTITQKEATEQAKKKAVDPALQGMIGGMEFFALSAALYPESFDTMLIDLIYYKEVMPFDQINLPIFHIHGDCDDDINYSQAVQAHEGIKDHILCTQKGGTHSCQNHLEWDKNVAAQFAFIKKHCDMEYDQAALDRKFE